jgi:shikimate kinase
MSRPDNIILVGPMGAGKTTIGRLLAAELRMQFVDSDEEIERRCGADIPWIFDMEGEQGFRDRETAVLNDLMLCQGMVVATGGGAIEREWNRQLLMKSGFVVYLYTTLNQQYRRTGKDRKRPLLQGDNPRRVQKRLMKQRDPLYREVADLVVVSDGRGARVMMLGLLGKIRAAQKSWPNPSSIEPS